MTTDELEQINQQEKLIPDRDMFYLLNIEVILLWEKFEKFINGMGRIKKIVSKLDENNKFLVSKHLALLIYKHKKKLWELSGNSPKSEERSISNIAKWTGLKTMLIFHFMSSTNRESVVDMIWKDPDKAIDDMELVRALYRDIVGDVSVDMKDMQPAQKLYWKLRAAKELLNTHFTPRKKPGALVNIEAMLVASLAVNGNVDRRGNQGYTPGNAPTLNDPDMKKRIEDGQRTIQDGEFETIDGGKVNE